MIFGDMDLLGVDATAVGIRAPVNGGVNNAKEDAGWPGRLSVKPVWGACCSAEPPPAARAPI